MIALLPLQRIALLIAELEAEGHDPDAIASQLMVAARHLNDRAQRRPGQRVAA